MLKKNKLKDFSIIFFSFCVLTSFGMWFPYGDGAVTIVGIKGGGPEREPSIIAEKEAQEFKEFGGRFLRTMQSERKLVSLILPKNHTISAFFW